MIKDFPYYKPGEPLVLNWKKQILRAACCNCALVHNVKFKVKNEKLTLQVWENKKMTKILRKTMYSTFPKE